MCWCNTSSGANVCNLIDWQEHQLAVVNCLEDPDDTLKLKTLELLYRMTRSNNVEVMITTKIERGIQVKSVCTLCGVFDSNLAAQMAVLAAQLVAIDKK